jgi:hypothetical protein
MSSALAPTTSTTTSARRGSGITTRLEVLHWERQIRASAALRRLLGSAAGAGMSRSPGTVLLKSTRVDLAVVALRLRYGSIQ